MRTVCTEFPTLTTQQPHLETHTQQGTLPVTAMSLLPADVQGALVQLLQALQSTDNTTRSQAEESLNNDWYQNRPDVLLMGLAEQIQSGHDTQVRLDRSI